MQIVPYLKVTASLKRPIPLSRQGIKRLKISTMAAGLVGLVSGCNTSAPLVPNAVAQAPISPTYTPLPTLIPLESVPVAIKTPVIANIPSPTPWPTLTPWPTATPWPTPAAWVPEVTVLPTLAPLPLLPTVPAAAASSPAGVTPISYAPPDGVDVFGSVTLRWEYYGQLAEDEWFDIKIKPAGSENSVFVDWSKSNTYQLNPWNGWSAGLYTWQIGIVQGTKTGDTKHFVADTGRDSQKSLIKWQALGHDGGGNNQGGNGSATGNGGGKSGGS